MRDVAIISFAQSPLVRREMRDEVEMLVPVIAQAIELSGIPRHSIGFTCSGSSDYLIGRPFSFVSALDAAGPWPPIEESHVEMDGAFAFYEAWMRLQHGDIDSALVFAFGRSSLGDIGEVLSAQLDPYLVGPLGAHSIELAALQARALIDLGKATEKDFADVARRAGRKLHDDYIASPLKRHDIPPVTDGAAAMVLVAGDLAKEAKKPVWIRGLDQRIEPHSLGARDLTRSESTRLAAERAGATNIDVAELHAPFSHQEIILRDALKLGDSVRVNPSGGCLAANPVMVAGLIRIGEAAKQISEHGAHRALAHATSGPCLQQNLVCVLEGGAK